jgi:hypothetical protein
MPASRERSRALSRRTPKNLSAASSFGRSNDPRYLR